MIDTTKAPEIKQGASYALVGIINTATDFAVFSLLFYYLNLGIIYANTAAFFIAVVQSYILNTKWTFKEKESERRTHKKFILFFTVQLGALTVSNIVIWSFSSFAHPLLCKLAATIASFIWGFFLSKKFVFDN